MKKRIFAISALCAAAAVIGGCTVKPEENTFNEYDELNAMLAVNYSQIDLTVTNTFDDESVLTSEYTMKFSDGSTTVNYSVERFAGISLDSASSLITTLTGEAVIADGKVTYVQGDAVSLDALASATALDFKEEYFENVELTGVYLRADVTNAGGFTGSELTCTDMKVEATFLEFFYTIKITYTAQGGNCVEYLYNFQK